MFTARLGSVAGLFVAAVGIGFSPVFFQGPLPVPPPRGLTLGVPPGQAVTSIAVSPIDGMPILARETHDPMPIIGDSAAESMPIRIMPLPSGWR